MKIKDKPCKGTGKTKGLGCGEITKFRKYGLCASCLGEFLFGTEQGKLILEKTKIKAKNKVKKELTPKRKYIKWTDKPLNEMIQHVQFSIVNHYIKLRDNECYNRCISSNCAIIDAGHYYPTTIGRMRFNIMNIHGQNHSDNRFKSGNLAAYKAGLIERHGLNYFTTLERLKIDSNKWPKLDRIELIKIGKTYEHLAKKRIWCFNHYEFENYKNIINK